MVNFPSKWPKSRVSKKIKLEIRPDFFYLLVYNKTDMNFVEIK